MMPFYFGSSGRSLFGIYEAPAVGAGSRGFVICNTLGREYYFAHRAGRLLAQRLAGAGMHALRFDQLGTGDSALDLDDVRWTDWVGCVAEAVDELRDMAGLTSVGLIGLRLGAEVAVHAAASCNIDRLVLWDPIPDRGRFLSTLAPPELARCFPSDWVSAGGAHGPVPSRTLLVSSRVEAGVYDAMVAHLETRCAQFQFETTSDSDEWRSGGADVGRLPMPVASIEAIVAWCRRG